MARTIEELEKRYARSENMKSPRGPMGGPRRGPGGPRGSGKPKNVGATVKRLCSYLAKYRKNKRYRIAEKRTESHNNSFSRRKRTNYHRNNKTRLKRLKMLAYI